MVARHNRRRRPWHTCKNVGQRTCTHVWYEKMRNPYGFSIECLSCKRKIYQPWSDAENLFPLKERETLLRRLE